MTSWRSTVGSSCQKVCATCREPSRGSDLVPEQRRRSDTMRNVIYWVHTSVDGYIAGPNGEFDWPQLTPELFGYSETINEQVDTLLYGRVVWDMFAAYWPTADANPETADDHTRAF